MLWLKKKQVVLYTNVIVSLNQISEYHICAKMTKVQIKGRGHTKMENDANS